MTVEIFALCDAANDSQGKLNMLGAFDTLGAASTPAIHPLCMIVTRLRVNRAEQGKIGFTIHITDEGGNPISVTEGNLEIYIAPGDTSAAANIIVSLVNLKFPKFGIYNINLSLNGKQQASIPLFIKPLQNKGKTND